MTVDLVFCLEADGEDTRMTVCAEVDPGGDIPTRVVELAVSQMTDRLRNIADTIKTHRTLVDKILRTQSVVDDDTSSTDEEDEDEDGQRATERSRPRLMVKLPRLCPATGPSRKRCLSSEPRRRSSFLRL